jgi:hypothetical protein
VQTLFPVNNAVFPADYVRVAENFAGFFKSNAVLGDIGAILIGIPTRSAPAFGFSIYSVATNIKVSWLY